MYSVANCSHTRTLVCRTTARVRAAARTRTSRLTLMDVGGRYSRLIHWAMNSRILDVPHAFAQLHRYLPPRPAASYLPPLPAA